MNRVDSVVVSRISLLITTLIKGERCEGMWRRQIVGKEAEFFKGGNGDERKLKILMRGRQKIQGVKKSSGKPQWSGVMMFHFEY